MNNFKTIKWILSLRERDRALALVMIAAFVLWIQSAIDKSQYNKLQDRYRIELVRRADSCDAQKSRSQSNDIIKLQLLVDSLVKENSSIINNYNKNVKVVKK